MNSEDKIKITYFNLVNEERSSVIAMFGCHEIKRDFYMSKLKLILKKDGGLFVAPPSEKYLDPKTGHDAYSNFFWYGPKNAQIFQETCLESIKCYCLRKGIPHPSIPHPGAKEVANKGFCETDADLNSTFMGI